MSERSDEICRKVATELRSALQNLLSCPAKQYPHYAREAHELLSRINRAEAEDEQGQNAPGAWLDMRRVG